MATPLYSNAPFAQWSPALASNGRGFLAVWRDHRVLGGPATIFAARIGEDGTVLDPHGIPLGAADSYTSPSVTWLGNHYLVVWSATGPAVGVRLTAEGRVLDAEPRQLSSRSSAFIRAVASNDSRVLIVTSDVYGAAGASVVDSTGNVVVEDVPFQTSRSLVMAAGAGTLFMVLLQESLSNSCPGGPECFRTWIERLTLDGRTLGRTQAPTGFRYRTLGAMASDGQSRFMLATTDPFDRSLRTYAISEAGEWSEGATLQGASRVVADSYGDDDPSLVWTGTEFAVAWSAPNAEGRRAVWFATLDIHGRPTTAPHQITSGAFDYQGLPALSSNGRELVAIWQARTAFPHYLSYEVDRWDIHGKLISPLGEEFLLTRSALPQDRPATASAGRIQATVWTDFLESENTKVLRIARQDREGTELDGAGIEVARRRDPDRYDVFFPATVASDGETFLIVWAEGDVGLRARRISTAGTWLHDTVDVGRSARNLTPQSMSWDGRNYFVVYQTRDYEKSAIAAQFLDRDGEPLGSEIQISERPYIFDDDAVVAFNGHDFIVVWTHNEQLGPCRILCPSPPLTVVAARLTRSGVLLDSKPIPLSKRYALGRPSIDWGGSVFLVTWSGDTGVRGTRLTFDGMILDGSPDTDGAEIVGMTKSNAGAATATAWSGESFFVFWRDRFGASRMTLNGLRIDPTKPLNNQWPARFVVSEEFHGGSPVQIRVPPAPRRTDEGVFVVYTRVSPEPEFGAVLRIFGRELPAAAPPRGRAVAR